MGLDGIALDAAGEDAHRDSRRDDSATLLELLAVIQK
jgi:hypothetical protein